VCESLSTPEDAMTNPKISRLRADIQKLHAAQDKRHDVARELKKDQKELKTDRRTLKHERDEYAGDQKVFKKDQKELLGLREAEQAQVDPLEAQLKGLEAAYDASIDPSTGLGDPTIAAQIASVSQTEAEVKARFDPEIEAARTEVEGLKDEMGGDRAQIKNKRGEIKTDGKEIKSDRKALDHAQDRVKHARAKALKDLTPAEYQMGLKQTNRFRKELGLKPVDHLIRPGIRVEGYYNGVAKQITVVPVGNGEYLRSDAARQWKRMVAAAARDGIHISAGSGFRTMSEQRYLYDLYLHHGGNKAAPPGYSNHQGGVAMDISGVGGYGTSTFNWLSRHAGHFGFRNTVSGEYWHWGYMVNG
jgi:hypothetical protein